MKHFFLLINITFWASLNLSAQNLGYPDCIMLTIPGDPATSRAVTWRTDFSDAVSIGEIALVNAAPSLEEYKTRIIGTHTLWEEGSSTFMGHKVIFQNLNPGTNYAYRVGNGKTWSEWFHFKTSSDEPEPFSFLYFGDLQNNIKSYGSRVLRQGLLHFPDSDFLLFVGDLVNSSTNNLWEQFFYAGGWMFGTKPSIGTPGNHEYDRAEDGSRVFSKHWNQIFTMPENGPSDRFYNRVYYIDYQGVRFITFDSPAIMYNDQDRMAILEWLEKSLANNPNRWSVVLTHFPVYGCSIGRNNEEYTNAIKPIIEKYGVDIVLQGHDHTYCRGQNLSGTSPGSENNPMYIVSVSGPKMYGLGTNFWSDRVASNTQLYQHISINGDTLSYESYTVAGDLYDNFLLVKNEVGVNELAEPFDLKDIPQRTEIPERVLERYSDQQLIEYEMKYPPEK